MTPAHLEAVTTFLAHVAQATGLPPNVDPTQKIQTMALMLAEKYPNTRMFCDASATAVAFDCGMMHLPSVAIIGRLLEKWWDEHKPVVPALTSPAANSGLPARDRMLMEFWLRDQGDATFSDRDLTISLAVIRQHAPRGYAWLVRSNLAAADIAVRQGWREVETPDAYAAEARLDWMDPERVRQAVRMCMEPAPDLRSLAYLNGLVAKHAPENLAFVPSAAELSQSLAGVPLSPGHESAASVATLPARLPAALPPEVLNAVRDANLKVQLARAESARAPRRLPPLPWQEDR